MKDRIIKFLSVHNLTSTKFADSIGVQRSSISHILSGRNKPSFDFIEKMLIVYPELNAQWLITGKGDMRTNQPSLFNQIDKKSNENLTSSESNIQNIVDNMPEKNNSKQEIGNLITPVSRNHEKNSDIERVIIFYTNGSFKEYIPE